MRTSCAEAGAPPITAARRGERRRAAVAPRQPEYLTRRQAAELSNLSTRTLERLERDGGGPPLLRVGVKLLYPIDGLHAWLRSRVEAQLPAVASDGAVQP